MANVNLQITEKQRRLTIGSYFTDLNAVDYLELVRIFCSTPEAKAYHEAEIIKELQRKIKSRTRYTDCSMPITEGERIEKHGVEEYNKAIEDAIVILAKRLPSPPKTDKQ